MNTREMQDENFTSLKKEKGVCILAHAYQSHDIWEVADFVGDSFALSKYAAKAPQDTIMMCGVRFMAETVKVLSPEKTALLANPMAGCPMAAQIDKKTRYMAKRCSPRLHYRCLHQHHFRSENNGRCLRYLFFSCQNYQQH